MLFGGIGLSFASSKSFSIRLFVFCSPEQQLLAFELSCCDVKGEESDAFTPSQPEMLERWATSTSSDTAGSFSSMSNAEIAISDEQTHCASLKESLMKFFCFSFSFAPVRVVAAVSESLETHRD